MYFPEEKRVENETWFVHNDIDLKLWDILNWKMSFIKKYFSIIRC